MAQAELVAVNSVVCVGHCWHLTAAVPHCLLELTLSRLWQSCGRKQHTSCYQLYLVLLTLYVSSEYQYIIKT